MKKKEITFLLPFVSFLPLNRRIAPTKTKIYGLRVEIDSITIHTFNFASKLLRLDRDFQFSDFIVFIKRIRKLKSCFDTPE